jgi:hypothetical protein
MDGSRWQTVENDRTTLVYRQAMASFAPVTLPVAHAGGVQRDVRDHGGAAEGGL